MQEFTWIRRVRQCALMLGGVFGFLLLVAAPSTAQSSAAQPAPAYVRTVDGEVLLDREFETDSADPGMPFVPGDRLRTTRGRAEVLFPDGVALDLDEFTEVSLQSPQGLRVASGRVWIVVPAESTGQLQIDTPAATAYSDGPGEFRIAVLVGREPQTELIVARGRAELVGDRGSVKLQGGERSVALANDVPSRPEIFNTRRLDSFDTWALAQRDERSSGRSAQYLPPDLRVYGATLDQYGGWQYDTSYGYVWYPAVDTGWRPYYSGYWATVPAYGWTWIGYDRWAWPTHHYGRWGYGHSRWFWIPERHWGTAWVSWGAAPGYVSWCPLGFDNRPVFGFSMTVGTARGDGWVVLPRERFGVRHERVGHYAVAPHSLPPRTPFVMQNTPPVPPSRTEVRRIQPGPAPADGTRPPGRDASQPTSRGARPRTAIGGAPAADSNDAAASRRTGRAVRPLPTPPPAASTAPSPATPDAARQRGPYRQSTPPAGTPDQRPAPDARRYPFGDFRRPGTLAPQANQPESAAVPRAMPRPRSYEQQRDTPAYQAPAPAPPPPQPSGDVQRRGERQGEPSPPARTYSTGRTERAEGGSVGAAKGPPPPPANAGGGAARGGAVRRAPQQSSGGGAAAPRGGEPAQRGDGRAQGADARRPR